jgi:hypothetical protein
MPPLGDFAKLPGALDDPPGAGKAALLEELKRLNRVGLLAQGLGHDPRIFDGLAGPLTQVGRVAGMRGIFAPRMLMFM